MCSCSSNLLIWWTIFSIDSWMRRCFHLKGVISCVCKISPLIVRERAEDKYRKKSKRIFSNARTSHKCKRNLKCKPFQSWEYRLRLAVIGQVNYKKIEIQTLFLNANNIRVKNNSQMQKIVLCKKIQLGKIRCEEKNLSDK